MKNSTVVSIWLLFILILYYQSDICLSEGIFVLQDCLVKQGMYTQYAETLLKNVAKAVNNLKYDVEVAKMCITTFHPQLQKSGEVKFFILKMYLKRVSGH
jgi:hypothetical protein